MGRFKFLVLFFALSVVGPLIPSVTANGAGPEWRVVSTQMNIQLAQRGRCKAFGETNKCKPTWDNRSKSCVCAGATGPPTSVVAPQEVGLLQGSDATD